MTELSGGWGGGRERENGKSEGRGGIRAEAGGGYMKQKGQA